MSGITGAAAAVGAGTALYGTLNQPDEQTVMSNSQAQIPPWMLPMLQQSANTGQGSLSSLSNLLNSGNLVAPLSPQQNQALSIGTQRALGQGGFIPTAQQQFLQTARGQPVSSFMPQSAFQALSGAAEGQQLPPSVMNAFRSLPQSAYQALSGAAGGQQALPGASVDALTSTAQGDFLFGGQGFDAAVDAAVRSAQPHILSRFGAAGRGTGGLAQAAIGQAATDAFAGQYGQERGRQLGAAESLAGLFGQQQSRQLGAAESLAGLELSRAGGLADILGQQQAQQIGAAGLLGDFGNQERQRQLTAAGALPGIGMADVDILSQLGAQQQAHRQQLLTAPITAQQMLLQASQGGLPGGLIGQNQSTSSPLHSNPFGSALGGGLAGLQFASLFGGNQGTIPAYSPYTTGSNMQAIPFGFNDPRRI